MAKHSVEDIKIKTDYLRSVYNVSEFADIVEQSIKTVRRMMKQIAFTGSSGAAMAYILSAELGIPLICVRKSDSSHYLKDSGHVEGAHGALKFIFVDDFICGGNTIRRVLREIHEVMPDAECVGAFLYITARHDYEHRVLLDYMDKSLLVKVFTNMGKEEHEQLHFNFNQIRI